MMKWWKALSDLEQSGILLASAIVVYILFRVVALRQLTKLAHSTVNDLDDRLVHFIRRFFGLILGFGVLVGVLRIHDIEISPLLAGAGIAGIAIGFAAKETLADILAGVFLIADRPLRIGDRVKVEYIGKHWGAWGDVVDIGLRRTRIRNTDGVVVNYPNALLANSVITNFSFESQPMRVRLRFQVGYDADLAKVREVTRETLSQIDGIRSDTVDVVVRSLWDDSQGHMAAGVLIEARYRIDDVRKRTKLRSAGLEKLLVALREAKIPMSAPSVHVRAPEE